jgi:cobalt/nickel transport system permease protein
MNPFPIDAYAYSNRLRWAHPAEKIIFAGVMIAAALGSGSPVVCLLALALVTLEVTRVARIPLRAFWYFVRLPFGFILISVLTMAVVVVPAGEGLFSVPLGPIRVGVTTAGLIQAGHVFCVSFACVAATLSLALTTPMVDITDQLRRWHIPALFVELMTLVYRFIFVLIETAQAMHIAQEARMGYCTAGRSLRSVGMLASNLFLRANARANALFTALTARGYTGDLAVLREEPTWSRRNLASIAAAGALLVTVAVAARLEGVG